ncbi:unnamed protein product [Closterium sp. NIES-65]|nr:unnamed protein product [Closterium sp. NIES-65]
MAISNSVAICGIFAVVIGLSSCAAVTAWSVIGHHPASVGHHPAGVGHHHHYYHTASPHSQSFSQAPSQYGHTQYSPGDGYSHDERDMLRRVESVRQQQQERDSQPPPLFTAVAAAAASGEPFLLDFPLKRASFAAAAAATTAATTAATVTATAAAATAGATRRQPRRRRTVIIGPVSLQRAATAAGYQPSKSRPQGSCSSLKKVYIINVTSAADFAARASLPPTTTVILYLRNDLTLPRGLFFRRQQSCTILMSAKWPGYTLTGGNPMYPVLRVWNTNNFLSLNVNYKLPVTERSPECTTVPELGKGVTCPAISIHRAYGVQIGKGNIFGRVDVLRSMGVRLDSLKVTGVASFDKSPGVIRVALCGYGPSLLQANIVISNNEVYGVNTPIVLHRGAVGVTVTNNYIHDYIFAGIRCGADVHYSGDCMLTRINSNLVISSGRNLNGDYDSAGIYYCTHWFNPGNSALCNYVFNGDHCYYLDYCTSGVLVRGGACVNTYDGMKVNNGKRNVIKHVAMKGTQGSLGWTSCLTVTVNNCLKDPGDYWERMRVKYYNSDRINRLWPWMKNVCKETSANGGVPCNPPGQPGADVTGACSGLGTDNLIDVVAVNTTDYASELKESRSSREADTENRGAQSKYGSQYEELWSLESRLDYETAPPWNQDDYAEPMSQGEGEEEGEGEGKGDGIAAGKGKKAEVAGEFNLESLEGLGERLGDSEGSGGSRGEGQRGGGGGAGGGGRGEGGGEGRGRGKGGGRRRGEQRRYKGDLAGGLLVRWHGGTGASDQPSDSTSGGDSWQGGGDSSNGGAGDGDAVATAAAVGAGATGGGAASGDVTSGGASNSGGNGDRQDRDWFMREWGRSGMVQDGAANDGADDDADGADGDDGDDGDDGEGRVAVATAVDVSSSNGGDSTISRSRGGGGSSSRGGDDRDWFMRDWGRSGMVQDAAEIDRDGDGGDSADGRVVVAAAVDDSASNGGGSTTSRGRGGGSGSSRNEGGDRDWFMREWGHSGMVLDGAVTDADNNGAGSDSDGDGSVAVAAAVDDSASNGGDDSREDRDWFTREWGHSGMVQDGSATNGGDGDDSDADDEENGVSSHAFRDEGRKDNPMATVASAFEAASAGADVSYYDADYGVSSQGLRDEGREEDPMATVASAFEAASGGADDTAAADYDDNYDYGVSGQGLSDENREEDNPMATVASAFEAASGFDYRSDSSSSSSSSGDSNESDIISGDRSEGARMVAMAARDVAEARTEPSLGAGPNLVWPLDDRGNQVSRYGRNDDGSGDSALDAAPGESDVGSAAANADGMGWSNEYGLEKSEKSEKSERSEGSEKGSGLFTPMFGPKFTDAELTALAARDAAGAIGHPGLTPQPRSTDSTKSTESTESIKSTESTDEELVAMAARDVAGAIGHPGLTAQPRSTESTESTKGSSGLGPFTWPLDVSGTVDSAGAGDAYNEDGYGGVLDAAAVDGADTTERSGSDYKEDVVKEESDNNGDVTERGRDYMALAAKDVSFALIPRGSSPLDEKRGGKGDKEQWNKEGAAEGGVGGAEEGSVKEAKGGSVKRERVEKMKEAEGWRVEGAAAGRVEGAAAAAGGGFKRHPITPMQPQRSSSSSKQSSGQGSRGATKQRLPAKLKGPVPFPFTILPPTTNPMAGILTWPVTSVQNSNSAGDTSPPPSSSQNPSPSRQPAVKRPKGGCTSLRAVYVLNITTPADFNLRLQIPPNVTVVMYLQNNLVLSSGLVFGVGFSCSLLMSTVGMWPGYTIEYPGSDMPAFKVENASNIVSVNVNWKVGVAPGSAACVGFQGADKTSVCPAIAIHRSYGVQVGAVRIDLASSSLTSLATIFPPSVCVCSDGSLHPLPPLPPLLLPSPPSVASPATPAPSLSSIRCLPCHPCSFPLLHPLPPLPPLLLPSPPSVASPATPAPSLSSIRCLPCHPCSFPLLHPLPPLPPLLLPSPPSVASPATPAPSLSSIRCLPCHPCSFPLLHPLPPLPPLLLPSPPSVASPATPAPSLSSIRCLPCHPCSFPLLHPLPPLPPLLLPSPPSVASPATPAPSLSSIRCLPCHPCSFPLLHPLPPLPPLLLPSPPSVASPATPAPSLSSIRCLPCHPCSFPLLHPLPPLPPLLLPSPPSVASPATPAPSLSSIRCLPCDPCSFPLLHPLPPLPPLLLPSPPSVASPATPAPSLSSIRCLPCHPCSFPLLLPLPPLPPLLLPSPPSVASPATPAPSLSSIRCLPCHPCSFPLLHPLPPLPPLLLPSPPSVASPVTPAPSLSSIRCLPCDPCSFPLLLPLPPLGDVVWSMNGTVYGGVDVVRSMNGTVYGRVDVVRSMNVRVDSLKITAPSLPSVASPAHIRVALSGIGPSLLKSNVLITNNEVYNARIGIVLHRGAVGVAVASNYVHGFTSAGIMCGAGPRFVGDCMLVNVSNNVVQAPWGAMPGAGKAIGIVFSTHWINPGNTASCNYVVNGGICYDLDTQCRHSRCCPHPSSPLSSPPNVPPGNIASCNYIVNGALCYDLDAQSSGVLVWGGACMYAKQGVRINNGKM